MKIGISGASGKLGAAAVTELQKRTAAGDIVGISRNPGSYADPDRNIVKLNVSNYAEVWASIEHIQNSPDFARRPLGVDVDPDKLVAAHEGGAVSPWELHKRAWQHEFAPAQPYDPRVML